MPRGRKRTNLSVEEQLIQVADEITNCQENLQALKIKQKELLEKKKHVELSQLYDVIQASGKSVEDFIEELSS